MNIIQDLIPAGRRNRPATVPGHARYGKIVPPKYITIHNAWSPWDAKGLNAYMKSDSCANRPASWHLSVSDNLVVQGVPFGETAWHAGDYINAANPGIGNSQSIGIEICDFYNPTTKKNDQQKYLLAEAYSIKLVAYLIKTVPSLLPFPECVVPHTKWRPASGCPSRILGRKDGWANYIKAIKEELEGTPSTPEAPWPNYPIPRVDKTIGVEVNGKRTNEVGYLINNATYVRAAYVAGLVGVDVTGHGNHIKINTKG
jgi:N-acetylmuramoyl-L-alanine amidase